MLSTTVIHRCRQCGSERLRKNGHANNGAQRARCLECGRTFHLEPKGPRYSEPFKAQVVSAYQDRMSTRGIRRTFGVCCQTLINWVGEKIQGLPAFEDTLLPSQNGDVLELDELWSFVQKKEQECWRWLALCRRTRQSVAYTIGDRSQEGAQSLREQVPEDDRRPNYPQRLLAGLRSGLSLSAPIAFAARRKGRPTTPNASLAPCAHA